MFRKTISLSALALIIGGIFSSLIPAGWLLATGTDFDSANIMSESSVLQTDDPITFILTGLDWDPDYEYQWSFNYQSSCVYNTASQSWVCPPESWSSWSTSLSATHIFTDPGIYIIAARQRHESWVSDTKTRIADIVEKGSNGGTPSWIMDEINCDNTEGYVWLDGQCKTIKIPAKDTGVSGSYYLAPDTSGGESVPDGPPIASLKFDPGTVVITGQKIEFDASDSVNGDGEKSGLKYSWSWGESHAPSNNWTTSNSGNHEYSEGGIYSFMLKVRDNAGQTDATIARITVTDPRPNGGTFTVTPAEGTTRTIFTFEPTVWDQLGTKREDFDVRWDFDGDGEWDTTKEKPQTRQIYYDIGMYTPRMLVINQNGIETIIKGREIVVLSKRDRTGEFDDYLLKFEGYPSTYYKSDTGRVKVDGEPFNNLHASFEIVPNKGNIYTIFTFDATDTLPITYSNNPSGFDLSPYAFRWDFENDGTWDTGWMKEPKVRTQFGEDGDHEIRLEVYKEGSFSETIRKIKLDTVSNPHAKFTAKPEGESGQRWRWIFDAEGSYDSEDGQDINYRWDFDGDGYWDLGWGKLKKVTHQYEKAGEYNVILEVRDLDYFTGQTEREILVYDNTSPTAVLLVDTIVDNISHEFVFDASRTTDAHTATEDILVRWDFEGDGEWDTEWMDVTQNVRHIYNEIGAKSPMLEAKDLEGFSAIVQKNIWVKEKEGPEVTIKVEPRKGFFSTEFDVEVEAEDEETDKGLLRYRYTWDNEEETNEGVWSPESSSQHKYNIPGWHTIFVESKDEDDMIGTAAEEVYIHPDSEYIEWLVSEGGTDNNTYESFSPDAYITRGEILKMLYEVEAPDRLPFAPAEVGDDIFTDIISPISTEIQVEKLGGLSYRLRAPRGNNVISYQWDLDNDREWDVIGDDKDMISFSYIEEGEYQVILEIKTNEGVSRLTTKLRADINSQPGGFVLTAEEKVKEGEERERLKVKIPFADVSHNDWYAPYVVAAWQDDVMRGFEDRHFRPDEPMSVVGALWSAMKMYGLDPEGKIERTFPDVPRDSWYAPVASLADTEGIWQIGADGQFNPSKPVTRAEAARILYLTSRSAIKKTLPEN